MNRKLFSILGLIILSLLLFGAGLWLGQTRVLNTNWQPGWMMGNTNNAVQPGYGMMGNSGMMGMMSNGMMGDNNSQHMQGMMNGQVGNMMGMMGGIGYAPDAEINITADEAVSTAQAYLDTYLPGKTADDHADIFPGYYALHILEDGETIGRLSVNAYTGQVFFHHWPGDFIEMTGGVPE